MLKLPKAKLYEPLCKTIGPRGELGFWMPVEAGPFKEEQRGKSTLTIWMEYDREYDRFLGALFLGCNYHVEVLKYTDSKDGWKVNDERADQFIGEMTDGNHFLPFEVTGFKGEWVVVISPFC